MTLYQLMERKIPESPYGEIPLVYLTNCDDWVPQAQSEILPDVQPRSTLL